MRKRRLIDGTRQRTRQYKMTMNGLMTIITAFHSSHHWDLKSIIADLWPGFGRRTLYII